jgi:superfamily I DNA/RNA helicase
MIARSGAHGQHIFSRRYEMSPKARKFTSTPAPGSPQQEQIWTDLQHGTEHLMVEARAGTGKTYSIVNGLARLAPMQRVAVLAFNVHVAKELNSRLQMLGVNWVRALTFNSLGYAAVRKAFPKAQLMEDKLPAIVRPYARGDRDVAAATMRLVRLCKNTLTDGTDLGALENLADRYGIEMPELREDFVFSLVPIVLQECLDKTGAVDFDDQIWLPIKLGLPIEHFDLVMVDESQDTNRAQQALMFMACPAGRIVLVGDRFQSVYGFRGAHANAMEYLYEKLRNTKRGCKILPLTVTRRCPMTHVLLAQTLVPDLEALSDAPDGEILVLDGNKATNMMAPGDMGLCRVNRYLVPAAYRLIKRGIKVVIQGRDFGQDLIALVDRLRGSDLADLLQRLNEYFLRESRKLLALGEKGAASLEHLEDQVGCIIELSTGLSRIPELKARIQMIFADYEDDGTPRKFVLLGTIHRLKGLEAHNVFVLAPHLIPHPRAKRDWELEQERNLAYIAVTRAKFSDTEPGRLIFVGSIPDIFFAARRGDSCASPVISPALPAGPAGVPLLRSASADAPTTETASPPIKCISMALDSFVDEESEDNDWVD